MIDVSELKCKVAASTYHKMIKDSYGIKDCCGQYDENEVQEDRLLISLYCGPFNIENIRNGFKNPVKKKSKKVSIKPSSLYIFDQVQESTIWIINHNKGYNPNVSAFDNDNNQISGIVNYTDVNNLTITFSSAQAGKAYLS